MIREEGGRLLVEGVMNHDSAKALLQAGRSRLQGGTVVFDLSGVKEVDSSGLSVIFGWQRAAAGLASEVRVANPPANLVSLAELYGVSQLLPIV